MRVGKVDGRIHFPRRQRQFHPPAQIGHLPHRNRPRHVGILRVCLIQIICYTVISLPIFLFQHDAPFSAQLGRQIGQQASGENTKTAGQYWAMIPYASAPPVPTRCAPRAINSSSISVIASMSSSMHKPWNTAKSGRARRVSSPSRRRENSSDTARLSLRACASPLTKPGSSSSNCAVNCAGVYCPQMGQR